MGYMLLLLVTLSTYGFSSAKEASKTKVFIEAIEPSLFNWTNGYTPHGYWYRASLINSPDLPPWMSYHFSKRHRKGFIYGVPPQDATDIQIEVVGLNREDYETRRTIIPINVTEKPDPAKFEIRLKIDNLNLEDMFESGRVFNLLNTITLNLWPESVDLYMTYLVSAVKMGARLPLTPNQGEGVVVHLGSSSKFSDTLGQLEQEVLPLRKLTPCPRDLKRSSVDRHFRPKGFVIDWCSFRLVSLEDNSKSATLVKEKSTGGEERDFSLFKNDTDLTRREDIPKRDYSMEIMTTLIVPVISLLTLAAFLSVILCVQHDSMEPQEENVRRSAEPIQRQQVTLRDGNLDSDGSPRLSTERDEACRPSPPPYSATKRFVFDS